MNKKISNLEPKIISGFPIDMHHIERMQANDMWKALVQHTPCQYNNEKLHWMWRTDKPREVQYWNNEKFLSKKTYLLLLYVPINLKTRMLKKQTSEQLLCYIFGSKKQNSSSPSTL